MDIFGRGKIKELEESLSFQIKQSGSYFEKFKILEEENKKLKEREAERTKFEYLLKEKIPEEQNARKNYFTDITTFYQKYFKAKIAHMISMQKDELIIFGRTQREDDFFRANISILYLIDDWFSHAEREYLSDLEETRQKVEENLASVDQINKKYNL